AAHVSFLVATDRDDTEHPVDGGQVVPGHDPAGGQVMVAGSATGKPTSMSRCSVSKNVSWATARTGGRARSPTPTSRTSANSDSAAAGSATVARQDRNAMAGTDFSTTSTSDILPVSRSSVTSGSAARFRTGIRALASTV